MALFDGFRKIVGARGKAARDAAGEPVAPQQAQPPQAAQQVAPPQAAPPPVVTDPNSEAARTMADMKKKYGLKNGGIIEKKLLRKKAEVMQKRGC